jgi:putative nucleotidyltransferase with HDIG domain
MFDINRYAIRIKVAISVLLSIVLILGIGYWITKTQVSELANELSRQQLNLFGDSLRETLVDLMKGGADIVTLEASKKKIIERHSEILELRIIHGASLNHQFGVQAEWQPRDDIETYGLSSNKPSVSHLSNRIHYIYPILADQKCLQCHDAREGEILGVINLTLDTGNFETLLHKQSSEIMLLYVTEITLLLLLLTWILNRLIFTPLKQLRRGAERLGKGDLSKSVAGQSGNEFGVVITSFNQMMNKIKSLLESQEVVIKEQSSDLLHLMETSQYIGSEEPISNVLQQFSKVLANILKVSYCHIVMIHDDDKTLEIKGEYPNQPSETSNPKICYQKDSCPNLWKVINLKDLLLLQSNDPALESELFMLGMHDAQSALYVPIMSRDKVHGVVVLCERRSEVREPIDAKKIKLCQAMVSQLAVAIELGKLYKNLVDQLMETVLGMAETVEKKSPWTAGHSKRVTKYSLMLADEIGWQKEKLEELRIAGLLHDIGKIGVPGSILNKEGKLSEEEYSIIKRHPEDGTQILSKIRILRPYIPIVRHHHEWFDGNGYPDGLSGAEIPLGARIMAIADAYDAMTADRPYRQGCPQDEAVLRLIQAAGTQFDPELVSSFKRAIEKQKNNL